VGNASKLGVGCLSNNRKALRQADELVKVTHIGCRRVRFRFRTKESRFISNGSKLTMHGLTQTSEETVSMAVDFVNGDVGVAVFCAT
jgi:hypothetical protein